MTDDGVKVPSPNSDPTGVGKIAVSRSEKRVEITLPVSEALRRASRVTADAHDVGKTIEATSPELLALQAKKLKAEIVALKVSSGRRAEKELNKALELLKGSLSNEEHRRILETLAASRSGGSRRRRVDAW
jgi:hypothetical protein